MASFFYANKWLLFSEEKGKMFKRISFVRDFFFNVHFIQQNRSVIK